MEMMYVDRNRIRPEWSHHLLIGLGDPTGRLRADQRPFC